VHNLRVFMSAAAVVLFIFVSQSSTGRSPDGVVAACVHALPDGARPVVRTASEAPPDEAVVADAAAAGAASAVLVIWQDPNLLEAQVRVVTGLPAHARWTSRRISFDPADQAAERDRALGLVIASVLDEGAGPVAATGPPPPAPVNPPAPAAPPVQQLERSVVTAPEPAPPAWAVEADVGTAFESGTDLDDSIGGAIGLRRLLAYGLAARAGLTFRLTERDRPDIRTQALAGSLGLAWTARRYTTPGGLGFGLRADVLGIREAVRYSDDAAGGGDQQVFWSLGADLVAEGGIGLSSETALLVGVGGEVAFTAADLVVGQNLAATLPRDRLILQLGVLARF
jgi:hypothetical protein